MPPTEDRNMRKEDWMTKQQEEGEEREHDEGRLDD